MHEMHDLKTIMLSVTHEMHNVTKDTHDVILDLHCMTENMHEHRSDATLIKCDINV